jgi:hypothetical protein
VVRRLLSVSAFLIAGVLGVGCAHSSTSADSTPKSARVIPPKLLPSGPIQLSTSRGGGAYADIEINVDSTGRADITSLRVIGNIEERTKRDIGLWLEQANFKPATQLGVPVPGVFKMSIKLR